MKAILSSNHEVLRLCGDGELPEAFSTKGWVVPAVPSEDVPVPSSGETFGADAYDVEVDGNGVPVKVVIRKTVRPKTADELRRVWSALEFDKRVEAKSPGAWDRLRVASENPALLDEVRAQLRAAIRQSEKAVEIVSDDPATLQFLGAATALGIITEAQMLAILNDE